jgi:hypothetical protein
MAKRHSPCGQLAHLEQVHGDWNMTLRFNLARREKCLKRFI